MNESQHAYEVAGVALNHVRNRNELRVADAMRRLLPEQTGFCGCRLCVEDVYAASLSHITPQYVQSGSIVIYKQPAGEEVDRAVLEAFARVTAHPKHAADGTAETETGAEAARA